MLQNSTLQVTKEKEATLHAAHVDIHYAVNIGWPLTADSLY